MELRRFPAYQLRNGDNGVHAVQSFFPRMSQCFVRFFCASCEGLIGQYVAAVSANQPGQFPKTLSSKPCDRREKHSVQFAHIHIFMYVHITPP